LANIKSSKRSIRAEKTRNTLNRWKRARVRNSKKKIISFIKNRETDKAIEEFTTFTSLLDKAVKTRLINPNNANRNKSRISRHINILKAT
jgi:small subunit ribosomal protein S20